MLTTLTFVIHLLTSQPLPYEPKPLASVYGYLDCAFDNNNIYRCKP